MPRHTTKHSPMIGQREKAVSNKRRVGPTTVIVAATTDAPAFVTPPQQATQSSSQPFVQRGKCRQAITVTEEVEPAPLHWGQFRADGLQAAGSIAPCQRGTDAAACRCSSGAATVSCPGSAIQENRNPHRDERYGFFLCSASIPVRGVSGGSIPDHCRRMPNKTRSRAE